MSSTTNHPAAVEFPEGSDRWWIDDVAWRLTIGPAPLGCTEAERLRRGLPLA